VSGIAEWALHFMEEHLVTALFFWLLLEESGIPMPLPGDLAILLAGARAGQGQLNLLLALVLIQAATLLGASVLYWVARRGGRPMLLRYGKFLQLGPDRLARAEDFLQRRGFLAVVAGRVIPGLGSPPPSSPAPWACATRSSYSGPPSAPITSSRSFSATSWDPRSSSLC
jgi:membrane protein DedA with SNARE-associated domain